MYVYVTDVIAFSRDFYQMIAEGKPLVASLSAVLAKQNNESMKDVLTKVRDEVSNGRSLSRALAEHPDVFDRNYVAMVKTGEVNGTLDEVLHSYTTQPDTAKASR